MQERTKASARYEGMPSISCKDNWPHIHIMIDCIFDFLDFRSRKRYLRTRWLRAISSNWRNFSFGLVTCNRLTDNWLMKNVGENVCFEIARHPLFPYIRGGVHRTVDTQIVLRGFPCVIEPSISKVAAMAGYSWKCARETGTREQFLARTWSLLSEASPLLTRNALPSCNSQSLCIANRNGTYYLYRRIGGSAFFLSFFFRGKRMNSLHSGDCTARRDATVAESRRYSLTSIVFGSISWY